MKKVDITQQYRNAAEAAYCSSGNHDANDIEIDDGAEVSESDDGAFVQAWVWVPKSALR